MGILTMTTTPAARIRDAITQLRNTTGQILDVVEEEGRRRVSAFAAAGRLVVAPGETIGSAWGNTVADQTVNQFLNQADALNQWPNPPDGALAYFQDIKLQMRYLTGAWHPAAGNTAQTIYGASVNATIVPASGSQIAFVLHGWQGPGVPACSVTPIIGFAWIWRIGAITPTSINIFVTQANGAALPDNTPIPVSMVFAGDTIPGQLPGASLTATLEDMEPDHRALTLELAAAAAT